eukprot:CAMPEP_0205936068 /NCGR_PEP_ID=MMETSP1325-20131115/40626_1 /ASSEMBLY_ACC=CAM_ASM_000708 /TAXON_ID=236786 /ORGANISM="Florenciella sp., Strain RCC1007" /LENGTH=88 /DNA_ID=CAMNT_0053306197 /DNA_START=110 /DNA_END=373 /DNA_ORIENTATION=+
MALGDWARLQHGRLSLQPHAEVKHCTHVPFDHVRTAEVQRARVIHRDVARFQRRSERDVFRRLVFVEPAVSLGGVGARDEDGRAVVDC